VYEAYESYTQFTITYACSSVVLCLRALEMVECMKRVASLDVELTVEERNLLSVAYKNVIGARRASWRIISSIEQKEESKSGESAKLTLIKQYRGTVRCRFSPCFCFMCTARFSSPSSFMVHDEPFPDRSGLMSC